MYKDWNQEIKIGKLTTDVLTIIQWVIAILWILFLFGIATLARWYPQWL